MEICPSNPIFTPTLYRFTLGTKSTPKTGGNLMVEVGFQHRSTGSGFLFQKTKRKTISPTSIFCKPRILSWFRPLTSPRMMLRLNYNTLCKIHLPSCLNFREYYNKDSIFILQTQAKLSQDSAGPFREPGI